MAARIGPLAGLKVLEIAGLAPVPFCGLILADFGADVIRVDRSDAKFNPDNLARGKRSIALDLKSKDGIKAFERLAAKVDIVVEPFRPGVMERLGLGPERLTAINPRLIYARLTGFGQTGPYANMAGHDIDYIALSGMLSAIGRKGEKPLFPGNLLGDFAGGGMLCAMGILLAVIERYKSGKGQVIDAAMTDGTTYLGSFLFKSNAAGFWSKPRGENLLDSGSSFYETYRTKDDKFVAVGAIEPQFYAALLKGLGLKASDVPRQMDSSTWPEMKERFAAIFLTKTRDEWQTIFDGTDACVSPIMNMEEVMNHPHARSRQLLIPSGDEDTSPEAAPAPRLSRTPAVTQEKGRPSPQLGQHTDEILREFGFSEQEINQLLATKAISKL